jgi:hypothetical protein
MYPRYVNGSAPSNGKPQYTMPMIPHPVLQMTADQGQDYYKRKFDKLQGMMQGVQEVTCFWFVQACLLRAFYKVLILHAHAYSAAGWCCVLQTVRSFHYKHLVKQREPALF